ncbi:MAG: FecR domain-containing protein [gamma proteobacterium symbiont of Taylorina sp.]|nr:FecR domain-containing protein [gamma proteobacterium symbiont of Taylorina sp.]
METQSAQIIGLNGSGEWRKDYIEKWQQAILEQKLYPGNIVRTGKKSKMALLFSDESQIRLHHNSMMIIKKILGKNNNRTLLHLNKGRAWSKSKNIPDKLFFSTPTAVAAIRGTDWEMEVDENGDSRLTVLHGEVEFYNKFGRVIVQQNEQALAVKGKAPVKIIITNPKERVQWVSQYSIEPIRYLKLTNTPIHKIKTKLTQNNITEIVRAQLLFDSGAIIKAEQLFRKLEKTSQSKYAQAGLLYIALVRHDIEQAELIIKNIKDQSMQEIANAIVILHILKQNLLTAENLITQRIKNRLGSENDYLILADLDIYTGDYKKALNDLDTGLIQYPDSDRFYARKAKIYLISDNVQLAKKMLQKGFKINPESIENLLMSGEINHWLGNGSAATAAYMAVIEINVTEDRAWFALGQMANEKEDITPAQEYLNKAVEINNKGAGYLGEIGILETFNNNFDSAATVYEQAIKLNPEDYISLTGAGLMELKKGNTETAINYFLKASLLEPRYVRAHTYLAIAYYQQNRIQHALQELKISTELDNNDPIPYFLMAQINNDQYQPAQAIAAGRDALKRMPYLKSLNQLATNQKGSANLGNALASFGLEDWSQYYAQESYYPYWAGSHLFLSDRYKGSFKKTSELFQGFLTDPTVFGADNKNEPIILTPGHYGEIGILANDMKSDNVSSDGQTSTNFTLPSIKFNGYSNKLFPVAYFFETNKQFHQGEAEGADLDNDTSNYIFALGAKPTEKQNYFFYAKNDRLKLQTKSNYPSYSSTILDEVSIINDGSVISKTKFDQNSKRIDGGFQYKINPKSQLWLKTGYTDNTLSSKTKNLSNTDSSVNTQISSDYNIQTLSKSNSAQLIDTTDTIKQHEFLLRQTLDINTQHEVSFGFDYSSYKLDRQQDIDSSTDTATITTMNIYGQETEIPPQLSHTGTKNQYSETQTFDYTSIYIEDRFTLDEHFLLHYGLHFADFSAHHSSEFETMDEKESIRKTLPRFGIRYKADGGWILRGAYQNWIKPSSEYTIASIATAGIPIDEQYVRYGGEKNQLNLQLETELAETTFIKFFTQGQKIRNTKTSQNSIEIHMPGLQTLRDTLLDMTQRDPLDTINETKACLSECEMLTSGIAVNHLLSDTLSVNINYSNTWSQQTDGIYKDEDVNYAPEHNLKLGLKWISHTGIKAGASASYLSYMVDKGSQFDSGISWLVDISKETTDKKIKLFAIAAYNDIFNTNSYFIGANYRF